MTEARLLHLVPEIAARSGTDKRTVLSYFQGRAQRSTRERIEQALVELRLDHLRICVVPVGALRGPVL
ncbi:MAG: hypothetical protein WBG86_16375 [Polyangiales bacterium]